jgi:hypothetical protein
MQKSDYYRINITTRRTSYESCDDRVVGVTPFGYSDFKGLK